MVENIANSSSRVRSQKLEFLRVLVPTPFAKLRIPGKIAKSLQNEPHKRATLYSPHGKFWHVGIRHEDDDMYLDEGWKEFAEALELRTGYFLLFQYKVNMVFSVKVFDNTMCLKEYVRKSSKRSVQDLYEDAVQTVGVPHTKDNMYCSLDSSCKRQKPETNHIVKRKHGREKREERINEETLKTSPLSSSYPRFVKIIKASHSTSTSLIIPKRFCTRHGLVSESNLFIVNTTGKSWPVQLILTFSGGKLKGFRDFVRANGLRKGDKCTFQLVNKNTFLVHVMASGAEKQQYSPMSLQNNVDLIGVPELEFERVVSTCYLQSMYIPNQVRKAIGLVSDCGVILRNQEGRSWPVEFFFKSNGEGHLGLGWRKFRSDNNIKEGDRCLFKLVEQNVLLFSVVYSGSADTVCNKMHTPTQVPKIMSPRVCSSSVLLEKASKIRVNNANDPSTSSVVEVPSIEAQDKVQNSSNYLNPIGVEKVQPIMAQKNLISVYVEKASSTNAPKEMVQNVNCSNPTGIKKIQTMKAPDTAHKNMISVCVEKAQCFEARKVMVRNNADGSSLNGIEKRPVNEKKKSSSICVEEVPLTDATDASSRSVFKESTISAQEELQNSIIDLSLTCIEKVQSLKSPDEVKNNSSSLCFEKTPPTESQKKKVHNNNFPSSTSIEKEQLIKSAEARKNLMSVCVEKAPCMTVQKDMGQDDTNSSSTSIENAPILEEKKSSSICVEKVPTRYAQKEKAEKREKDSSSAHVEKRPGVQQKMSDWSSTRFLKVEKIVLPSNVNHHYMVLSKEFCKRANLHLPCRLILKDLAGGSWQVDYSPNYSKGNLKWKKFVDDKKLKAGDKCIFKLVSHDTLLVNVVRK